MSLNKHNEVIMRTITLNDEARVVEQKKIQALLDVKKELIRSYKVNCCKCKQDSYLKEMTFVQKYSVDMDSDWHPYDFKHCHLRCNNCNESGNSIPQDIIDIVGGSYGNSNWFKDTIKTNDSRW